MFNGFLFLASKLNLSPIRRKSSGEYFVLHGNSNIVHKDKSYFCQCLFLLFVSGFFLHTLFVQKNQNPIKTALTLFNLIVVLCFGTVGFVGVKNAQDIVDLLNSQVRFGNSKSFKGKMNG